MTAPKAAVTDLLCGNAAPLVTRPSYDRSVVTAGIAHLGVGNFHRVHEALYVDRCLHLPGQSHWGIVGIGLCDSESGRAKAAAYRRQDNLYTVTEYDDDGIGRTRLVGAMVDYLHAPADPEAVLARLADPTIRIVSLTITEGAYNFDEASGEFRIDQPDVAHDLTDTLPRTAFGFLTAGLARRRAAGIAPFTVVSCDNLRSNGDTTKRAVLAFAGAKDPELAGWIAEHVAFPNSMVDRIAPGVTAGVRDRITAASGVDDLLPAIGESFTQWVIQDNFPTGRPRWDEVGVEVRDDVGTFETVKGRMLNACHMLLSYPAILSGYRLVHEAVSDPALVSLLRQFLQVDVIPHIQGPPGVSLPQYAAKILQRFSNPAVGDQLLRIATDGATKIPTFHGATIARLVSGHHDVRREAFLLATYRRYLSGIDDVGADFEVIEPQLAPRDRQLLTNTDPVDTLGSSPFAGLRLGDDAGFVDAFRQAASGLTDNGTRATLLKLTKT